MRRLCTYLPAAPSIPKTSFWAWLLLFMLPGMAAVAQPANDNCSAAISIPLGTQNFGLGVFTSAQTDLTGSTLQFGEPIHAIQIAGGTDKKSVWYKFTLPTHRGVRLELKQPGNAIPQADCGFTVYYSSTCLPTLGDIPPAKLTPLNKFGNSFNPCLEPGEYLVQVTAKQNAFTNNPIFLELILSYPGVLNSYDLHTSPLAFGTVSGNGSWTDFDIGCLTIEDTTESCAALGGNFREYTQSSWHTFTTDNYVDYVEFEIRQTNIITGNPWSVGYKLFQGNAAVVSTPWTNLTLIDGCRVLNAGNAKVGYKCQLLPNTTYSIQLIYHKDLEATTGIRLTERGLGRTRAPSPPSIPSANQLGTLPGSSGGIWTYEADTFACNARMADNLCGSVVPASYSYGGYTYNLNDWFTFTLSQAANVRFTLSSGCLPVYGRLYSGNVMGNCNLSLYQDWSGNTDLVCLPAGTYSLQVMGIEGTAAPLSCNVSHLSQSLSLGIRVTNVTPSNIFSLSAAGAFDTLVNVGGVHTPLPVGVQIYGDRDEFGCANTVLPSGNVCGAHTKAIYRVILIPSRGILTVGGGNNNFSYRLYQGNANALAIAQSAFNAGQVITGLVDQFGCSNLYSQVRVCVDPGFYTLVSFGDVNDVGASDQPWVRFDEVNEKFNLEAADSAERVNNLVALTSGVTYTTTLDRFDCNQTTLPSGSVCGASNNRAMYRIFTVNKNGIVKVGGGSSYVQYSLYRGNANALAISQGAFGAGSTITGLTPAITCQSAYFTTFTTCVTPGTYTLVTFGDNNDLDLTDQPWIRFTALNSKFNLEAADSVNKINNLVAINPGTTYNAISDHFDCYQTVLPAGNVCGGSVDRAMYREVRVGTTGILTVGGGNWFNGVQYKLYQGDANALAIAQGAFNYPQTITGLTDLSGCQSLYTPFSVCVSPGVYTLVSFGTAGHIAISDQPWFRLDTVTTLFPNPLSPNFIGDVTNSGGTGILDRFSCLDNPLTIDGRAPCNGATKQIYRTFYLSSPRIVSISVVGAGQVRLFAGNSAAGVGTLTAYQDGFYGDWGCFSGRAADECYPLPAGYYTVVTYGSNANLNQATNVTISILPFPPSPNYNRPFKAYNAGNTPWCAACDVGAYPVTKVSYTFGTEQFNCIPDTPFAGHPIVGCAPTPGTYNRMAYYVFTLTQESYVRLRNIPSNMRVQLYDLDVRADSTLFPSTAPIQNCISRQDFNYDGCTTWIGEVEFCRLQPGTYTFVIFASNAHVGTTLTPVMWVEKVENSRFDHARNAYDFGAVPGNNLIQMGKVGDVNPLNAGRAPSNDFFTCRTGAQPSDPGNSDPVGLCWRGRYKYPNVATVPYPMPQDYPIYEYNPAAEDTTWPPLRRNLWYSFVINGPGTVHVSVFNRTTGQMQQYPFTVYESDVDATLPWASIVAGGMVDSTYADSLKFVRNNSTFYSFCGCSGNTQSVSFNRDACDGLPRRYFVLVDHHVHLELNNQVEVGVRYDSVPAITVRYDHFTLANRINGLGQQAPPYTNVNLGDGIYAGAQSSFLCATRSPYDPNACGDRTLWYRVDVGVEGLLRLQFGTSNGDTTWNANNMRLYYCAVPGDSTTLVNIPLTSIYLGNRYWGQTCITPGTYYVQLTGCNYTQEQVTPYVWVVDQPIEYDHYSQANVINGLGQTAPPYTVVNLTNGTYRGDTASFACATRDPSDQNACGTRTLWYAFDVANSGKVNINYTILGGGTFFNAQNVMLFRELIPGDSTSTGLVNIPLNSTTFGGQNWGTACFYTGRYYLMLTGCWYTLQEVYPTIRLVEEPGDYCTNAITMNLINAGTVSGSATVDCHTIGEAFGEDGSNMGCLFGPGGYKSTWFKVSLTTSQKVDLTFSMSESTTASPTQIRYRVMYGNCGAMTAGPCNTDALTEFTLNCMQTGDYYVQVVTPENATGTVTVEASTVISPDQNCIPLDPTQPVANFTDSTACEGDSVYFYNQSTQGVNMVYQWNFGDGNTSTQVNPVHLYPTTGTVTTYNVTLIATDTTTGNSDTITIAVTTYPQPYGFITRDVPYAGDTIPGGVPVNWHSNASGTIGTPPTAYYWNWNDGQTSTASDPSGIAISQLGTRIINLTIMNGTCAFDTTDTIMVGLEPIYAGGPRDGADYGEYVGCPTNPIWVGGPYDGADLAEFSPCVDDNVWVGGPRDGADVGEFNPCVTDTIWAGGPFDGADFGEYVACDTPNVWVGGPFDGADMAEEGIDVVLTAGNDTICAGNSVTLQGVLTTGGVASGWLWNTGATTQSITVSPSISTWYTVTATLTNGCGPKTADFYVHVLNQAPIADAGPDITLCGAQPVTIGTPAVAGFLYAWTPTTGLNNPNIAQPAASPGASATYTLTVSVPGGTCPDSTDAMDIIITGSANVVASNDTVVCPNDTIPLTTTGGDHYVWVPEPVTFTSSGRTDALLNGAFTATSGATPSNAKYSNPTGWQAGVSALGQYLQVDLGAITPLHRIGTKGSSAVNRWVTSYQFAYSRDNITWHFYKVAGAPFTFAGNVNNNTPVTHDLPNLIAARYVRFYPQTWVAGGIGMRVDVFTAPEMRVGNPYNVTNAGTYVVHGHVDACAEVDQDTVAVSSGTQTALQYRTRRNGNWTDVTIWQVWDANNSLWVNAELFGVCLNVPYPTSRSMSIQVRDSVYYDFTIPYGIDETTIDPISPHNPVTGGVIYVPLGQTLFLVDSSSSPVAADLLNNGRLAIEGTFTPVGVGLLQNTDPSTVAYLRNGNQTMWNGRYGRLEADGSGIKTVSGANTLVRTEVEFLGAYIQLNNLNITLDTACVATGGSVANGYMVTNGFGQVVKRQIGPGYMGLFTFPIGPSTASFNQAILTNTGVTDNFRIRVSGLFEFHPNFANDELADTSSVNRTWHLNEGTTGGSSLSMDVFWYGPHENVAFDRNSCTVGKYSGTVGWQRMAPFAPALGTGTLVDPYHQVASSITTDGPFSVGSCELDGLHYRTIANGNWTDLNIWEVYDTNSLSWIPAMFVLGNCGTVQYPTSASLTVQVRHDVLYDYSIPIGVDQVSISPAGHLTVPLGNNLILVDGPGSEFPTGLNTRDLDNRGYFEITGDFTVVGGAALVNSDPSTVHYNGGFQNMWAGYYGNLIVDGPTPNAADIKSVVAPGTFVKTSLEFRNAKIALGNFDVELHTDASVLTPGQNTGYMIADQNGYCQWNYAMGLLQSHLYPVGGNIYSPATIIFDTVTVAGTLGGRVRETQHPTRFTIFRYWTMTQGTMRFAGFYDGIFQYDHADLPSPPITPAIEYAQVEVGGVYNPLYIQPGGWRLSPLDINNTIDVVLNTGTIRNDSFSDFTFMPIGSPLPVQLTSFDGRWEDRDAYLFWQAQNEQYFAGYILERSFDGLSFDSIAWIPGRGGVATVNGYDYLDHEVAPLNDGDFFYRLRMVDLNGAVTWSNVVHLNRESLVGAEDFLTVYPNPAGSGQQWHVQYHLGVAADVEITLFDVVGKLLHQRSYHFEPGMNEVTVPTEGLSDGSYYVRVRSVNGVVTRKVLIVR